FYYSFDEPGFVATFAIYDSEGRLVKTLFSSELLGTKGVFHWDGINEQQQKAPIGIYFCRFEAFQLNGT
uniref:FlgD immunoglobulin-like domain containing protein n=1 Tax=Fluviicola sp. TaxID=1917219 RepID=UPI00404AC8D3